MDRKERNLRRKLARRGLYHVIMLPSVGCWRVDGCCGYAVTNYHDTAVRAIGQALKRIESARKKYIKGDALGQPVWLYS